ncbi:hypothetical protein GQ53DRAFT_159784 [Thozetella sp. PMI_491]|nr:hypothetical protein GQ53DRAFT_159784 [Thozetella sp. PMI_491]
MTKWEQPERHALSPGAAGELFFLEVASRKTGKDRRSAQTGRADAFAGCPLLPLSSSQRGIATLETQKVRFNGQCHWGSSRSSVSRTSLSESLCSKVAISRTIRASDQHISSSCHYARNLPMSRPPPALLIRPDHPDSTSTPGRLPAGWLVAISSDHARQDMGGRSVTRVLHRLLPLFSTPGAGGASCKPLIGPGMGSRPSTSNYTLFITCQQVLPPSFHCQSSTLSSDA